ncbi:efflux RND transporter permease subunit [Halosquirtibacter laminarini]|uniref:Efflux RND transporter permease subunit n=1 Tax=Halosquirtibacter laminarini TaxID=3374600 RepID=A0AC61NIW9_9BACT|nr:efflux RND transporter permease subunit [Prolixibacteraceae bacterium]
MVRFLLKRPIAVSMTFVAILLLGISSLTKLPVSLMPDIDIPKVTVHAKFPNRSAQELEQTVAKPLRQQLMQVSHLVDIKSKSRDGSCIIDLDFEYGSDIDFVFIEVNEKIDQTINSLPREIQRPKVIKASATDIPVFYLNLTLKNKIEVQNGDKELFPVTQEFINLSNFSSQVVQKRIEQLKEVALVDISGQVFPELLIVPDKQKMEALQVKLSDIEQAIRANNIKLGNLLIRDGQYQYNIRFESTLRDKKNIENIYLKIDDRLLQLKDIAEVVYHPTKRQGLVTANGEDAITMAIIKQSDAQIQDLKHKLNNLIVNIKKDYPNIHFEVSRNQTQLLDYSISNLQQSLILGSLLAFLLMFLFLKDLKTPFLIGITIPTSLVIAMLFFFIIGISINIISLSGLILGVGMMIDNSIIVIDNITQHRERGKNIGQACIDGTHEVIRPLLSSVLTTCAVFIPLIFISGISGALFYDQAMAIAIGLLASLAVSITLLPVYYRMLYAKSQTGKKNFLFRINALNYGVLYEKGFRLVMKNQKWSLVLFVFMISAIYPLSLQLKKQKLPHITKDETLLYIDWNERIHLDENRNRTERLIKEYTNFIDKHSSLIGNQQFLLNHNADLTTSETIVYLKATSSENLDTVKTAIKNYIEMNYASALHKFSDTGNIFDLLFSDNSPPLIAKLRATQDFGQQKYSKLQYFIKQIKEELPNQTIAPITWEEHMVVKMSPDKLTAFNISFEAVYRALKSAFSENKILIITENQQLTPVILGSKPHLINEILEGLTAPNNKGEQIRLYSLLREDKEQALKNITAGREGEYYPINLSPDEHNAESIINRIKTLASTNANFEVDFDGTIYSNRELLKELLIILAISLFLLYFILASQFESLSLPLIVLLEVPVDIFGAFLFLRIFGESLNLMSLIGIIVMSGIIINDSILKIDTIVQLRKQGYTLLRALAVAGQRRLKPILMTSLTTILALLPFLFISGIGAELQRPLALAVIGGMIIGTIVSLYFIPLLYYRLESLKTNGRFKNY